MNTDIKREVIADGVAFSEIVDKKLKTNLLKIKFVTELSEKEAPLNSMAAMLIGASNKKITTIFIFQIVVIFVIYLIKLLLILFYYFYLTNYPLQQLLS